MNQARHYLLLFSITVLLRPHVLAAQPNVLLDYADSLTATRQFSAAITELKRFVFFHPADRELYRAFMGIGLCYREEHDYSHAINYLQSSQALAPSDSIYEAASLEIALTYFASGDAGSGLLEVERVLIDSSSPRFVRRALFVKLVALIKRHDWEQADSTLHTFLQQPESTSKDSLYRAVDSAIVVAKETSMFSEEAAEWLSAFFPGLGQLYSGDYKNAVNALALDGLLGYWVVDLITTHQYFDGVLLFSGAFLRYYLGNQYRAAQIAHEKNEKIVQETENKILKLLSKTVEKEE
jgi:tetratricopeptide (TPR) repeat protein